MGSERVVSVLSDGHTVPEHVEILEGRHSTVGFSSMQLQGPASEESAKSEVTEDALKLSRMVGSETPDECFSPVTGGGLVLRDLEITQPSVVSGKSSELSPVAWRKPRGGEVEFSPVVVEAKEDYDDAFSQSRMMPSRLHSLTPHARTTGGYESEMPEEADGDAVRRRGSRLRSLTPPTQREAEHAAAVRDTEPSPRDTDESSDGEVFELVETTRGRSSTWGPEAHQAALKLRGLPGLGGAESERRSSAIL